MDRLGALKDPPPGKKFVKLVTNGMFFEQFLGLKLSTNSARSANWAFDQVNVSAKWGVD